MSDVNVGVQVVSAPTVDVSLAAAPQITLVMAGQRGPAGASGDLNFSQAFSVASSVNVVHNLGKYPAVTVIDSAGDEVEGDVEYISNARLTVTFSAPFSGTVYCN